MNLSEHYGREPWGAKKGIRTAAKRKTSKNLGLGKGFMDAKAQKKNGGHEVCTNDSETPEGAGPLSDRSTFGQRNQNILVARETTNPRQKKNKKKGMKPGHVVL